MTPENKKKYFRIVFITTLLLAAIARHFPHPLPPLAEGDKIKGSVTRVVDGHMLYIKRNQLVIWGITVPTAGQAGYEDATKELVGLTKDNDLTCTIRLVDPHNNSVARCKLPDNRDVGEMMVRSGWARDYPRFTEGEYKPAEESARTAHLGQWATH